MCRLNQDKDSCQFKQNQQEEQLCSDNSLNSLKNAKPEIILSPLNTQHSITHIVYDPFNVATIQNLNYTVQKSKKNTICSSSSA